MRLFKTTFFGALATVLLCSTLAAQPAAEVKCGMMVTANLTLASDLHCPGPLAQGAALLVVASGVTVDLNGHAISGSVSAAGIVVAGADNVTIHNGELRGFGVGAMVGTAGPDRAYYTKLTKLRLTGNVVGALLQGARFGEVSECEASHNSLYGIVVFDATDYSTVSHNLVYGNGQGGIVVGCNPRATDPAAPASACDGLHSTENTVESNSVIGNGWSPGPADAGKAGIGIFFGDRNVVRANLVVDNNTVQEGEQLNVTSGILVGGGADNLIADNQVLNNGRGIQVLHYPSVPVLNAVNTVVSRNSVLHNASSGIAVWGEAAVGTAIVDNNAVANGHTEKTGFPEECRSGIRVQGSGATLMNNRSYDNIGYGFNVEDKEVRAQFGNRAARNGAASQCTGLACR